jgi:hypothetical protein
MEIIHQGRRAHKQQKPGSMPRHTRKPKKPARSWKICVDTKFGSRCQRILVIGLQCCWFSHLFFSFSLSTAARSKIIFFPPWPVSNPGTKRNDSAPLHVSPFPPHDSRKAATELFKFVTFDSYRLWFSFIRLFEICKMGKNKPTLTSRWERKGTQYTNAYLVPTTVRNSEGNPKTNAGLGIEKGRHRGIAMQK